MEKPGIKARFFCIKSFFIFNPLKIGLDAGA